VTVGRAAVAAAQQREAVAEAPVDLLDRHHAHLRGRELDRQREAVEAVDHAADGGRVERGAGPRRGGALAEQARRVLGRELTERVDALGRDRERRPARGQHPQVGGGGDEERDELGDRADDVLAVVEDEQGRRLVQALGDAATQVGALGGGERPPAAERVAHAQDRADLGDDVLRRGDADELDHVDDRLGRVARDDVRQARLAQAPGADDRHHARAGEQPAQRRDVGVAAEQGRRVVPDARALRPVERQQVAVDPLQPLARVRAEPLAQIAAVGLVALERGAGPADGGLAAQQVREQRLVLGVGGVRGLEGRQRVGVRTQPARRTGEDGLGLAGPVGGGAADLGEQLAVVAVRRARAGRERERLARERPGARGVVVERGGRLRDERGEPAAVDLGGTDAEPVAGRVAHDRVGPVRGAGARDEDLERLRRVGRRVVAPDELDEPLVRHRAPLRGRQRGQQRAGTIAGDGCSAPPHVLQQRQRHAHPGESTARAGVIRGPRRPARSRPPGPTARRRTRRVRRGAGGCRC